MTPSEAMAHAVKLAKKGPWHGPNPRVGCVLVDRSRRVVGEGYHRGAGTSHAEVEAMDDARRRGFQVEGSTAYVTLEPCRHVGRTGPCAEALAEAGVARVVYAVPDPGPISGGGADVLRRRGVEVRHEPSPETEDLVRWFVHSVRKGRPYVVLKFATTLDGKTAAADGSSRWVSGERAREHAHRLRARADAIIVGTGTVLIDDPTLSARPGGRESAHQPLRVIVGQRDTSGRQVWRDGNVLQVRTHDPGAVLDELHQREARMAILEGGATLSSSFLRSGLVDEVNAYVAPMLLGSGTAVFEDLGIRTIGEALLLRDVKTSRLGSDILVTGRPKG
ncbi:MAG: bifunctional diaminohydroxyphosphoribosylaminopyrimidine deaminase/5-amino-6-(5-phosphoribosylamino)uracil reductase RibD [Demequinaceae bacterium]|nr:bifunctional diaminohydroxyphosphoribosylaminopyrimidine deaminase/5-amino-6-(5-phosphoribosylamino)uracil reductase RibD [Demequinaceae bacterium]